MRRSSVRSELVSNGATSFIRNSRKVTSRMRIVIYLILRRRGMFDRATPPMF